LTGTPAFKKGTPAETVAATLKEDPTLPAGEGSSVLEPIVNACLEKNRNRKLQTARGIVRALASGRGAAAARISGPAEALPRPVTTPRPTGSDARRRLLVAAAVVAALAVAAVVLVRSRREPTRDGSRARRLVVLPFENLGTPEDNYFADG